MDLLSFGIQPERVCVLNPRLIRKPPQARYVLYWMQQAQRISDNHALSYAQIQANERHLPLVVVFALTDGYPGATLRHYRFMLEGLQELRKELKRRGLRFLLVRGEPDQVVTELGREAALVVVDGGYTRIQRQWRQQVAKNLECPLIEVESDCIVPPSVTTDKQEFGAYTIRRKINRNVGAFLSAVKLPKAARSAERLELSLPDFSGDIDDLLEQMKLDRSVPAVSQTLGGAQQAERKLLEFLENKLGRYAQDSRDPSIDGLSGLSPYLHFGQISANAIARRVLLEGGAGAESFLEQLIVRRELAVNYVLHNLQYDRYAGLPDWAKQTLGLHRSDKREYLYSIEELTQARTHDPYWNAAQKELLLRGTMHGYMRMYWGKKILEWSRTPERAFEIAVQLNDAYQLDGRDPNGYVGVAWCFGAHDRPWKERAIFGKIRYMNDKGLRRKFDIDRYVQKVAEME